MNNVYIPVWYLITQWGSVHHTSVAKSWTQLFQLHYSTPIYGMRWRCRLISARARIDHTCLTSTDLMTAVEFAFKYFFFTFSYFCHTLYDKNLPRLFLTTWCLIRAAFAKPMKTYQQMAKHTGLKYTIFVVTGIARCRYCTLCEITLIELYHCPCACLLFATNWTTVRITLDVELLLLFSTSCLTFSPW